MQNTGVASLLYSVYLGDWIITRDSQLCPAWQCLADVRNEKNTRGELRSALDRVLAGKSSVVIFDTLNNIKVRYQAPNFKLSPRLP